jgi:hypothetical protein
MMLSIILKILDAKLSNFAFELLIDDPALEETNLFHNLNNLDFDLT